MDRSVTAVDAFKHLRIAATTVAATFVGVFRIASNRGARARIVLMPGDAAPDFALPGSDGRTHRLADSRGREALVIAWFPKAFTGGCTAECESLGRSDAALSGFRAKVLGASVDSTETNRRFAASMGIGYPILSDPDGTTAKAFGVLGASGFPSRWTFYIGDDGRILHIDRNVMAATHGAAVAARLEALGIARRT